METQCNPDQLEFHGLGRREVVGRFDGGRLTSDGGGLLLREVDRRIGLLDRVASCFTDYRDPPKFRSSYADFWPERVGAHVESRA